MNLSDLQTKEVVDVASGKRIGSIIDVIISSSGNISKIVLEETKGSRRFLNTSKDEVYLDWQQLIKIGDDIILVDVRVPSEYEKNHLSEAINIPMMRFVDNSYKNMLIDTNKKILLYCEGGYQSEIAAGVLKKAGYDAISFAMK